MSQTISGNTYSWDDTTKTKTITVTSSNSATIISCNSGPGGILTSSDKCYIICEDDDDNKSEELQCGQSGTCEMKGNSDHCWHNGIINATGSDNFIWNTEYKTSEGCTMHLPYRGNATIYANAKGDGVLKKTTIISHETNFIDITIIDSSGSSDVWKDECKALNIDATDANYLKLTLIDTDYQKENVNSYIYCPQNSNISPSCIIDASQAESVADLDIYALNGTPQDLIYTGNSNTAAGSVWLYCLDIGSQNSWSAYNTNTNTYDSGDCYITLNPTKYPTISPTKYPTKYPTITPTFNPTKSPTYNPTINTISPSKYPTISPTFSPTMPTRNPVTGHEGNADIISTILPTALAIVNATNASSDGLDAIAIIAIVLSILVLFLCGCGIFVLWKYQSLRAEKDSEIIRMQSNLKQHKMNGLTFMPMTSDTNLYEKDGHRTTQTSPWMIPGQNREQAYSTTIELGGLMAEGNNQNSNKIIEENDETSTSLKEGAGQNTGNMDINEDDIITPNGYDNGVMEDIIGGIATPMGDYDNDNNDDDNDVLKNINNKITIGNENDNNNMDMDMDMDGDILQNINNNVTIGNDNSDEGDIENSDDLLIENDVTIMDENDMKRKKKKQQEQFGQILGDEVVAQDIVMDDIINEIDTDGDDEDDGELLHGVDTMQ